MSEIFTLFSSSAGNSTCLTSRGTSLLIDAGGSCKRIVDALQEHGVSPQSLDGIVLTHEHSDHVSALRVLLKKLPIPVFATPATLDYLILNDLTPDEAVLCPIPAGAGGMIGDIAFESFSTPHDACDTCGYAFTLPDGKKVGFATDLGYFADDVWNALSGCDTVVLESNYDTRMLDASSYPYALKRRIKGMNGHLSNEDCAAAAVRLVKSGVRRLLLAHTSKENNLEQLALSTTQGILSMNGVGESDVQLEVAPKFTASPVMVL